MPGFRKVTQMVATFMRVLVAALLAPAVSAVFAPNLVLSGAPKQLRAVGNSSLYSIPAPGYKSPVLLADVHGTHEEMGYALGQLLKEEATKAYELLLGALLGPGLVGKLEAEFLGLFLDWQWTIQKHNIPQDYLDELTGLRRADAHVANTYQRGIVIAALAVGDPLFDIETMLLQECRQSFFSPLCSALANETLGEGRLQSMLQEVIKRAKMGCSHWGAWSDRTVKGHLFAGRNLDWLASSGIADYKLLTVFHPPAPQQPHVTVGFAGILGALTGMNSVGVTVHESGNDNKLESPSGMPWVLRLRMVLENAATLHDVRGLWLEKDNMMGVNHGFGSGLDAAAGGKGFLMTENKATYTAFFEDNDPREAALVGPDGTHYGFPMENALWRTNHGYDPEWLATAKSPLPDGDSFTRYMLIHDTIDLYGRSGKLGMNEAVNVTAVVTDKGGSSRDSFVTCGAQSTSGINILSAVYAASTQEMYVSFEEGLEKNKDHVTGGCSNYVYFDLYRWFHGKPRPESTELVV